MAADEVAGQADKDPNKRENHNSTPHLLQRQERLLQRQRAESYRLVYAGKHTYHNDFLHLTTTDTENVVASVDTKGHTWRATRVCLEAPATLGAPGVIGQSQRRLLYVDAGSGYDCDL